MFENAFASGNPYEAFSFQDFWEVWKATFISFYFIFFVLALVPVYYLMPRKIRWTVLLAGSVFFYAATGIEPLLMILVSALITWSAAILIEGTGNHKRNFPLLLLIITSEILLAVLIFIKLLPLYRSNIPYVVPLGISYYTFSAISYLADVYRRKDRAERNFLKLALFLLFFPKILQGPISRHTELGTQLTRGNRFDYEGFCFGVQLAMWGYFKKLVIADRIALFTRTVFSDLDSHDGAILLLATALSAIQLYCDFSGCMDIAGGVSEMFGVRLEKNFNRPFFSRSAAEFWRRWHITLGTWFKDYVYMPLAISPRLIRLSGAIGKKFGKRTGRAVMTAAPLLTVWLLTGLWHGTGVNYIAWGVYWGVLITLSTIFAPEIRKFNASIPIDTNSAIWKRFQIIRTFLLFCVCRVFVLSKNLEAAGLIFFKIFLYPRLAELSPKTLFTLGLDMREFILTALMIGVLWYVEIRQEKGESLRRRIAHWNMAARCAFYAFSLLFILIFGIYGPSYATSDFVYMQY